LYVDDMADACIFLMENGVDQGMYNVGIGEDVTIRELAQTIMNTVGFQGQIIFDASKPDGTPRKLMDVSQMTNLGWRASTPLYAGISLTYEDFLQRGHD